MSFNHFELEKKWQQKWADAKCFRAEIDTKKPKYYALDMFPYPSGLGLHVGHFASYTPTDVIARFKRAKGFNVLHPMGYDAFGLPAEQFAIQTGVHPAITTEKAIDSFRATLKTVGYSFDWDREISTADKNYYKWTQYIFLKLFERGLAYQKEVPVNWCPELKTVLANDEIVDGKSERGGHPVVRIPMKQWMLKITDYAERLINDLDLVDWPEKTKEAQRNWIGKSEGASVQFSVEGHADKLEIFTTRPDTIYGVSFMVLAPEHPLVTKITSQEQKNDVDQYIDLTSRKSEVDRKADDSKTGVFTGGYALNPFNNARIPIWIADYVLMDYGTGAIMAVPGHDERDFAFAQKYQLPVLRVIESQQELPFTGDGKVVNSDLINGLSSKGAIAKMLSVIEQKKIGERKVNYKLRDWLFSRQRYWGEPFPVVEYDDGSLAGVPENELPVTLPEVPDYQPSDKGEAPLARNKDFVNYINAKTKAKGKRITDTMPGSAGSSWYFLRYCDPHNDKEPVSFEAQKYWMPVDLYVGGPEHTVGHLLYARFWQKVLFDVGITSFSEPIKKLAHQGVITGPDGFRMSKSRGNVVNADEIKNKYGADAVRVYICFLGPFDKDKPWDTNGIEGVKRFLDRIWRLVYDDQGQLLIEDQPAVSKDLIASYHKTIKKVGEDIEKMNFNTAVAAMMIFVNDLYKEKVKPRYMLRSLAQLLAPFAPHVCEEIYAACGGEGFASLAPWPEYDPSLAVDDSVEMGVQVNGKMRGTIQVSADTTEEQALQLAKAVNTVSNALADKNIVKVVYKPMKILNLIIK